MLEFLPIIGSVIDNIFGDNRQEDAQNFSAQQYATRYQTQTKDMIAAGLNPMLSVSQGAGASPTSQANTPGNNFTMATGQMLQNKVLEAQARKTNAEANVTEQYGTQQAEATLNQTLQSTGLTAAQTTQVKAQTDNIIAELANIKDTNMKIRRAAELMFQQANLAYQQQLTETQRYEVVKAQIGQVLSQARLNLATTEKTDAQTKLIGFDIQAAQALDNLGRTSKELTPIIDIMRLFLRR